MVRKNNAEANASRPLTSPIAGLSLGAVSAFPPYLDRTKFPLVFAENCSYGMRRNLWGMKRLGIGITVTGMLAVAIVGALDPARREIALTAAAVDIALLLGWPFIFTPAWVRAPADAYAERLLEACEKL